MAIPLIVLAAKAGGLAKVAGAALAEWNRLPSDSKARLQREASDVTRGLNELRKALGARLFGSDDGEISWEEARALALNPRPEFSIAKEIVVLVRQGVDVDEDELRSRFAGGHHSGFEAALAIAREDGYIRSVEPGRWRITTFGDHELVGSDDVSFLEQAIVDHVEEVGLAGRDELALAVGAPEFGSPPFLAAVERALASGAVEWLGPGLYGLPQDALARRAAPPSEPRGATPDSRKIKAILGELAREIAQLKTAVSLERSGRGGLPAQLTNSRNVGSAPAPHAPAPQGDSGTDPFERLRRLKELVDAGVLTEDEFNRKKAEILTQM